VYLLDIYGAVAVALKVITSRTVSNENKSLIIFAYGLEIVALDKILKGKMIEFINGRYGFDAVYLQDSPVYRKEKSFVAFKCSFKAQLSNGTI
jgi:hypothetical protein